MSNPTAKNEEQFLNLILNTLGKLRHRSVMGAIIDRLHYYAVCHVLGTIWKFELALRGIHPLSAIRRLTIIGRPQIGVALGSEIEIGDDVVLMSSSRFCLSASLYAPCKIRTICASARIQIGNGASFNGTSIVCRSSSISVGARTMIGPNVTILDSPFHFLWPINMRNFYSGKELDESIEIGEDVWIGAQVIVLAGSKIGSGSVIGAGSIVTGVVPPNCLAVGSPARVIKRLDGEDSI